MLHVCASLDCKCNSKTEDACIQLYVKSAIHICVYCRENREKHCNTKTKHSTSIGKNK